VTTEAMMIGLCVELQIEEHCGCFNESLDYQLHLSCQGFAHLRKGPQARTDQHGASERLLVGARDRRHGVQVLQVDPQL
jgi:hypothetical protein